MDANTNNVTPQPAPKPAVKKLELINRAREVIRGSEMLDIQDLKQLCKDLEANDQFAYATEILLLLIKQEERAGHTFSLKNFQTLAKYIYKDHSLPSSFKFDKALNELKSHDDLLITGKCESLGLAGAIYKRKWMFDHQFRNLILSQHYYKKGFDRWKFFIAEKLENRMPDTDNNDDGYNAINYAYINDLMAIDRLEEFSLTIGLTEDVLKNLSDAKETREYILKQLVTDGDIPELKQQLNNNPWVIATVAEAYFGLFQYDKALQFIKQYIHLSAINRWETRSFNQQIFSLGYLQLSLKKTYNEQIANKSRIDEPLREILGKMDEKKMNNCLRAFMSDSVDEQKEEAQIQVKKEGKVGLALSGGGFRASLFHIGVLASLAERDKLKDIEILSCVSGGSIIGAHYYLKLKKVLQENTDASLTKQHYLNIVKEIEEEFLAGVQKNLRMRIFSNLFLNFKMIWDKNYSRSHRIGELYEKYFYKPLTGKDKLYMGDLFINPKLEEGESFSFSNDNWKRNHKVPQLVLNATSVNTGHNWQFTASWMGEPPGNIQTDIDVKPRLRRMYYEEAPEKYKQFRLGHAVGASACVPVMFHPMPLPDLYEEDIDLQLIDGGLHDNQGIAALIEQECRNMIISDASGQMSTTDVAIHNEAAIFFRADTILQERLRELQFMDIKERNKTTQLDSLLTIHLKNGLEAYPIKWIDCIDPTRSILYEDENPNKDLLKFGVLREVQKMLSEIRTDLDSFNEIEAYGLMYSGYVQTNYEINVQDDIMPPSHNWNFLKIQDYMKTPVKSKEIKKYLIAGKKQAFKVLDISALAKFILIVMGIIVAIPLLWLVIKFYNTPIYKMELTAKVIIGFLLTGALAHILKSWAKYINYKSTIAKYVTLVFLIIAGFIVSNIYLLFFNGIYNKAGKLKT